MDIHAEEFDEPSPNLSEASAIDAAAEAANVPQRWARVYHFDPERYRTHYQWRHDMPLEILSERQNHRCCWCGIRMDGAHGESNSATYEHIKPQSHGGHNVDENLVAACYDCNQLRRTMPWYGFLAWIRACRAIEEHGADLKPVHIGFVEGWYLQLSDFRKRSFERYYGSLCMDNEIQGRSSPSWHTFLAFSKTALDELYVEKPHDPLNPGIEIALFENMQACSERQGHRCCFCGKRFAENRPGKPVHLLPKSLAVKVLQGEKCVALSCNDCYFARPADAYSFYENYRYEHQLPYEEAPAAEARSWLWSYLNKTEQNRLFASYIEFLDGANDDPLEPQFFGWLETVYSHWKQTADAARKARQEAIAAASMAI